MTQVLRAFAGAIDAFREISPVRARAKVMARESADMREALVRLRHDLELSQRDVAERMGISQQAVCKLERYDADPRLSTLERYANAVGALVYHRVEVDRGQSARLAEADAWLVSRHLPRREVRVIVGGRSRVVHDWHDSETLVPEEMLAS